VLIPELIGQNELSTGKIRTQTRQPRGLQYRMRRREMLARTEMYRTMSVKPLAVLAMMIAISTPDAAQTAVPPDETVQYQECDGNQCGTGNSGTWTFRGANGEAHWPSGAKAALTLESSGDGNITVRRVDTADSTTPGFTAVYRGKLRNGRYEGTVDASWPGHFPQGVVHYSWSATVMPGQPQPSSASAQPTQPSGSGAGTQAASPSVAVANQGPDSVLKGPAQMAGILDAPAPFTAVGSLPKQMRFCGIFCFRLTLANDHYEAVQEGSTDGAVGSIYSVVRFSPQAIEFYRNDANHQFAILTGRMSSDGNRLVDGSIAWYQPDGSSNTFSGVALTWGPALMEARASAAAANPALGQHNPRNRHSHHQTRRTPEVQLGPQWVTTSTTKWSRCEHAPYRRISVFRGVRHLFQIVSRRHPRCAAAGISSRSRTA
jgi:hypothetical protein